MECPTEVAEIILEIIRDGILRIRCESANDNSERCGVEANHIHNVPNLLKDYSEEKLLHYYRVEIPGFVQMSDGVNINSFRPAWAKLGRYLELRQLSKGTD